MDYRRVLQKTPSQRISKRKPAELTRRGEWPNPHEKRSKDFPFHASKKRLNVPFSSFFSLSDSFRSIGFEIEKKRTLGCYGRYESQGGGARCCAAGKVSLKSFDISLKYDAIAPIITTISPITMTITAPTSPPKFRFEACHC